MLRSPATSLLRSAPARRAFTTTAAVRTSHPAHSKSDEGTVGGDTADTAQKNSLVPVFMAVGAASVAYITYAQISAGKEDRKTAAEAPKKDNSDGPVVLGEKPKMSSRG
ncbi:hypothetical protein JCM8202_005722 [Rhodotorula sphaerocarpa]